jgi:two-component system sensor histidine kinase KdpD
MSAGVGQNYTGMCRKRMLYKTTNVNIKIGYVETHGRKETQALMDGLSIIPRREVFYKG